MTLEELITTNCSIGNLYVTIRDRKYFFIDEIHIGSHVDEDKIGSSSKEPRWKCIKKPINTKETGSQYWGIILKNIPKELLSMEVHHWRIHEGFGFRLNNGCWQFCGLFVDVFGEDKFIEAICHEENDQLEGQMSIEDFLRE